MRLVVVVLLGLAAACAARPAGPDPASKAGGGAHERRAECRLPPTGCHSTDECHGRGLCAPALPTSDYGCGIPPHRIESCKADPDCPNGQVCNSYRLGGEVGHRCEARLQTT